MDKYSNIHGGKPGVSAGRLGAKSEEDLAVLSHGKRLPDVGFDVAVVGGGASGLFASWRLAEQGKTVLLLELNERVGKKLLATGNGKSNISSKLVSPVFYNAPEFVSPCIAAFGAEELEQLFLKNGLVTRSDACGRIYPYSESSASVLNFFLKKLKEHDSNLTVLTGCEATSVALAPSTAYIDDKRDFLTGNGYPLDKPGVVEACDAAVARAESAKGNRACNSDNYSSRMKIYPNRRFALDTRSAEGVRTYFADNVVLSTGSSATFGKGTPPLYSAFGHGMRGPYPSLVPLSTERTAIKGLSGNRCRAKVSLFFNNGSGRKLVATEDGEVMFKDFGVGGIAVMNLSAYIARGMPDVAPDNYVLSFDFAPDLSVETVVAAIEHGGTEALLKPRLAALVSECAKELDGSAEAAAKLTKSYEMKVLSLGSMILAQVVSGGLDVKEFSPVTMESLLCNGLFAVGEALDVDGLCGGYNLHFAFASAEAVARFLGK